MQDFYIGQSIHGVDAESKVTGKALFPGDINLPNQAFLQIVFAQHAHAIIKKIDIRGAEQYPGVIAVFTAKDIPCNEYGLIMPDQPVLCGPGSLKPYADRVRFIGDQVALVIGENEDVAKHASGLIKIEYEDLPVITDAQKALQEGTYLIHPDNGSNIFCKYRVRRGDVKESFKLADIVIEGDYHTPSQEHVFLQPEAGLGYIDEEGRVTVIVAGQWAHEDQEQIAHALKLIKEKVRVIYPAIGGAFGGREDMSVQIDLALAAYRLDQKGIKRPVKTVWSRAESFIGHHKRHPYHIHAKWGATRKGKLIAAEMQLIADGGAYAYTSTKVLGNATLLVTGPYDIPNVKIDSYAVYTNNIPNGAFRGFGAPQACFAAEMQMNKLAEALDIDPVEIRMRNLICENVPLSVGTPLPKGISIKNVIEECAKTAGWEKDYEGWKYKDGIREKDKGNVKLRGIGFAAGFKNVGFSFGAPEECWATIELYGKSEIERAILHHAGADVGQGSHTVFVQIAASALNIPINKIELIISDTAHTDNSGSASASRMTFMAGNSIYGAAKIALTKWKGGERPAIGRYQYKPPPTTPLDPETGECMPNFAYGYLAETVEVEVDKETGDVHILRVVCANDVGKAINPLQVKGQIEGGIVQAVGYAIMENFIQNRGMVETSGLSTYLIPTIMDIPDKTESIIMEIPDPLGPKGARGMGEMPFIPFTPAIVSAVHGATDIWYDSFPLTQEAILKGLGELDS
ncbi:MAG TPA: xanthine dehydrogenase family protein [Anaerolineae bacterium]|nr:xanthine dehydrogenase family protein [Anaerolineae bacterium]